MNSLDKKGLASLKFGDIIENGYASADNPTRVGVFIRFKTVPRGQINAGKKIECRSDNGTFWITDFGNDRLRKIGSILADRAAQAERMARLEEAKEKAVEKIEGVLADLDSAIEVAFNRGAVEWTRLNYPKHYKRLSALSQEGSDA